MGLQQIAGEYPHSGRKDLHPLVNLCGTAYELYISVELIYCLHGDRHLQGLQRLIVPCSPACANVSVRRCIVMGMPGRLWDMLLLGSLTPGTERLEYAEVCLRPGS